MPATAQGGRVWQPFCESKNGHKYFLGASICYFRNKCVVFARNCKFVNFTQSNQCQAGRVSQYRVGSGRVLDKIPGSGSGSGRVGRSKNMIGYFRVSFLLSGISGYVGYFRVFLGFPIYTRGIF